MLKQVYPNESTRRVSHQTIYTAIYALARGELKRQLIACLRFGKGTRLPRSRGTDRRGPIPDMVSMHVRPPEIEDRAMHGHWEGDFIKGAGNKSSVGVGFKSFWSARVIIAGIETMRMIRKGKLDRPGGQTISTANQFRSLAA
jgi:IS30 family transposase